MSKITDPLVTNYTQKLADFVRMLLKVADAARDVEDVYFAAGIDTALQGYQDGDTLAETQATKAKLVACVVQAQGLSGTVFGGGEAVSNTLKGFLTKYEANLPA